MKFYAEHKINPVGGCLPLLVQLPVFIILYNVIRGLTKRTSLLDAVARRRRRRWPAPSTRSTSTSPPSSTSRPAPEPGDGVLRASTWPGRRCRPWATGSARRGRTCCSWWASPPPATSSRSRSRGATRGPINPQMQMITRIMPLVLRLLLAELPGRPGRLLVHVGPLADRPAGHHRQAHLHRREQGAASRRPRPATRSCMATTEPGFMDDGRGGARAQRRRVPSGNSAAKGDGGRHRARPRRRTAGTAKPSAHAEGRPQRPGDPTGQPTGGQPQAQEAEVSSRWSGSRSPPARSTRPVTGPRHARRRRAGRRDRGARGAPCRASSDAPGPGADPGPGAADPGPPEGRAPRAPRPQGRRAEQAPTVRPDGDAADDGQERPTSDVSARRRTRRRRGAAADGGTADGAARRALSRRAARGAEVDAGPAPAGPGSRRHRSDRGEEGATMPELTIDEQADVVAGFLRGPRRPLRRRRHDDRPSSGSRRTPSRSASHGERPRASSSARRARPSRPSRSWPAPSVQRRGGGTQEGRIRIDIAGYRQRRREALEPLHPAGRRRRGRQRAARRRSSR